MVRFSCMTWFVTPSGSPVRLSGPCGGISSERLAATCRGVGAPPHCSRQRCSPRPRWSGSRCARQITWFAALMLTVLGLGLLVTFLAGDTRFLLLEGSVLMVGVGVVLLLGAGWTPLTPSAGQTSQPGPAAALDELFGSRADLRRRFTVRAVTWGTGPLAESIARLPLVRVLLPRHDGGAVRCAAARNDPHPAGPECRSYAGCLARSEPCRARPVRGGGRPAAHLGGIGTGGVGAA